MRRLRASSFAPPAPLGLLLVGAALFSGCGPAHLFYDIRELRHEAFTEAHAEPLRREVKDLLDGRSLTWRDRRGERLAVPVTDEGLRDLPLAELAALWVTGQAVAPGGESDVRVQLKGRPAVPVSVLYDTEGNAELVSPRPGPRRPQAPALDEAGLRRRFALAGKLVGKWGTDERRALVEALELLGPAELALLRDTDFERRATSPDGNPEKAALFSAFGCRATIFVFSSGVTADRYRFVGDPSAPRHAMLHAILHEVGHALEYQPARALFCQAEGKPTAERNALIDRGNALARRSPVLGPYLPTLGDAPAPTAYGETSDSESFAESFALAHVDPAALLRARPQTAAWFADRAHLRVSVEVAPPSRGPGPLLSTGRGRARAAATCDASSTRPAGRAPTGPRRGRASTTPPRSGEAGSTACEPRRSL